MVKRTKEERRVRRYITAYCFGYYVAGPMLGLLASLAALAVFAWIVEASR